MDYTRGEWKASKTKEDERRFVSYIDCGYKTIARTMLPSQGREALTGTMEEAEANARLISATPDMYEALVMASEILRHEGYQGNQPVLLQINKALAKAEGKEVT